MKNILIYICLLCFAQSLFAQKDVSLIIKHKLGTSPLVYNQTASTNLGYDFQITRLQYYISNITLFHDSTQTVVTDKFILTDRGTQTVEVLGNYNIIALDSISFGIGVGPDENHLDPSSYPFAHPLAPKSPSMHWGWTSGYRFIAFEGVTGSTMSDLIQIHSIGDSNYKIKTIATNGTTNGNALDIIIDADYVEALRDININNGVINHGELGVSKGIINNFNKYVFKNGSPSVPIIRLPDAKFALYPNPVKTGNSLTVELENANEYSIQIYDFMGKLYQSHTSLSNEYNLQFKDTGLFVLNILKKGKIVHSEKITIHE